MYHNLCTTTLCNVWYSVQYPVPVPVQCTLVQYPGTPNSVNCVRVLYPGTVSVYRMMYDIYMIYII